MSYAPITHNYYSTDLYRRTHHVYEEAAPLGCAFNSTIPCDRLYSLPWQEQYAPLGTFTGPITQPIYGPPPPPTVAVQPHVTVEKK